MLKFYGNMNHPISNVEYRLMVYRCNFCKGQIYENPKLGEKLGDILCKVKRALIKNPSKKELKEKHFCRQASTCEKEYKELYD